MQTHEIRQRFIEHFTNAGHTEVPSASLILDDPNLLFVNAGMVPFKPYFLGQQTPPFETATSIQKCVRTLDIEEVGITTRHNTFFQMAGNFSFGNYFKEGAITHAWTLLTKSVEDGGFGLDPERLWVTVYLDDDEAAEIWEKKIGVPAERIQRLGMEDNYWSMGVPGPCGPCSEIYYDRGPEHGKEGGPIADDTRYMEIWNLVFMQNERGEGLGKGNFEILGPLPKQNIDTGMGIERVACLLQDVDNVYETDLLRPVIDEAERLTGAAYGSDAQADVRFRVIADHCRTGLMLMLDGVTPGNEGRGYILRRLLRRIIRSARLLGARGETMEKLMETVSTTMTPSYPEIADSWERIRAVAVGEEKSFLKTLESGTRLFDEYVSGAKDRGETTIPGDVAFTLHDTHGFPIDLTMEMAQENNLQVDEEGFHAHMAEQKARAKADNNAKKLGHADQSVYRAFVDNHATVFTGYTQLEDEGKVLGLISEGALVDRASEGTTVQIILDRTPFYAEAGGQMADRGVIKGEGFSARVDDVQKVGKKVWVHNATITGGTVAVGNAVTSHVDNAWRHQARQAHSGTHLIHAALREVLGPTAVQAGSLNKPGYLRFDFNYGEQLTDEQLRRIEDIANGAVDSDYQVNTIETSLEEAKAMGAMALFGENYGSEVRVVEIGGPFSMELCGGIHVEHSSQIGPIAVLGESSVASGVRRIEAYTGMDSFRFLSGEKSVVSELATSLKTPTEQLPERIDALTAKLKDAEKQIQKLRNQQLASQVGDLIAQGQTIGDTKVIALQLPDGVAAGDLRTLTTDAIGRLSSEAAVVLFTSNDGGKVPFVAAATSAAVDKGVKAGDLVKTFAEKVGGRGGGKPALAQGSGTQAEGIQAGLEAVKSAVETDL
ncbi:alanine--tRNA ligase [Corynebacterium sp. zg254]|uniref:Alanine--tRNA ligase n=1 Tax=Corynebacterium zhongnanshanii TaxID=2768834 RepID=A0ABQ6VG97_9CORY|nr:MULTISPECIES: alanine--tRNA ligase [Corynebacterium]KAB3523436.1 alanine--tRNA ligase [Corynebacterium zhongnanshanii]MCR5913424.1 alanine--tRNA ligase [Corynebacterium sp. zg254]